VVPPVVDFQWVNELVLADVRWYLDGRDGEEAYRSGHLPGAVFVDLERWLAGPPGTGRGRHPLPPPETFALGMSSLGIGDDTVVVAYDDDGGGVAARLVWMLRATGHEAALLDGGLQSWDGTLETRAPVLAAAQFAPRPWPPERLAGIDDATASSNVVLDARSPERYSGQVEPVDPRAGHIPAARNLPWKGNLDGTGRFLSREALRERFSAAGVSVGAPVVSYCGSGVTACHNLLALAAAGLPAGVLYPGSWSAWAAEASRPAATGPEPG